MQCSQFWMAAAHLHLGQGGFRGMHPCLQAQILRKVGLSSSYMEEKLDQGALGMSDPSPVSHRQGDQVIRKTRFIRVHQRQRHICSASPAVHHLQCFTYGASPVVHHLRCITCSASPAMHYTCRASPKVHHLECITCSASPAMHHLRCIPCGASPVMHYLRCISCGASPGVHLLQCISCGA